jgi:hypothetical protein
MLQKEPLAFSQSAHHFVKRLITKAKPVSALRLKSG